MPNKKHPLHAAIKYAKSLDWGEEYEEIDMELEDVSYFMSAQRATGDKSGSYVFHQQVCTSQSEPSAVYIEMLEIVKEQCGGSKHQQMQVIAFNRI